MTTAYFSIIDSSSTSLSLLQIRFPEIPIPSIVPTSWHHPIRRGSCCVKPSSGSSNVTPNSAIESFLSNTLLLSLFIILQSVYSFLMQRFFLKKNNLFNWRFVPCNTWLYNIDNSLLIDYSFFNFNFWLWALLAFSLLYLFLPYPKYLYPQYLYPK